MVMQWPAERDMQASASMKSASFILPARTSSLICQTAVPEPIACAVEIAVEHRAAGDDQRGQIAARRAHHQRRRGLVAAAQQHDAVDRIAADGFLHVHAGQVAEQHGGGPDVGFAQRHHRELQRKSAGFVDAALHTLGDLAEVGVAGRQLGPGVADADHRPPVEKMRREALVLHPGAMNEAVAILLPNQ